MSEEHVTSLFYEYLKRHVKTNTIITRPDGKKFVYNAETQLVTPIEEKDEIDEWFAKL